ncbi:MAG: CDP-diacylglycerol--serine O-phosphatidyltransferase [Marivirga sp.]|jgi:CDP-diacylglycerol--serine O-phosphatidyltransferase
MIKKQIPNLITAANLLAGCVGILFAIAGDYENVIICIALAAVFDFFDGFVARLLQVHSEIGKQLDSLADMVTFGVLPSFVMYHLLLDAGADEFAYVAFLIAVLSAFRLAKFNVDTRQSEEFIGLPTPANALFVCSLFFLKGHPLFDFIFTKTALSIITIIFSFLLVAELRMIALKFKSYSITDNLYSYLLIFCAIVILAIFQFSGISFVIVFYIVLSIAKNLITMRT